METRSKAPSSLLAPILIAVFFFSGCLTEADKGYYKPSDPAKLRAFLVEQNILRLKSDGAVDENQTILAMVEWSRINMSHTHDLKDTSDESNNQNIDAMTLIENGRAHGYLTVHGCWGATDIFAQLLGSVDIETEPDTITITGGLHSRLDFPNLKRTTLHMDDVYLMRHSAGNDIPSIALLAPLTILNAYSEGREGGVVPVRRWKTHLVQKYLPDIDLSARALLKTMNSSKTPDAYGDYPTVEEVKKADKAGLGGKYPITNEKVLRLMDAAIDRLGGPTKALAVFNGLIDYRTPLVDDLATESTRHNYIPLPKQTKFPEHE